MLTCDRESIKTTLPSSPPPGRERWDGGAFNGFPLRDGRICNVIRSGAIGHPVTSTTATTAAHSSTKCLEGEYATMKSFKQTSFKSHLLWGRRRDFLSFVSRCDGKAPELLLRIYTVRGGDDRSETMLTLPRVALRDEWMNGWRWWWGHVTTSSAESKLGSVNDCGEVQNEKLIFWRPILRPFNDPERPESQWTGGRGAKRMDIKKLLNKLM